jgi:hypothetical protein
MAVSNERVCCSVLLLCGLKVAVKALSECGPSNLYSRHVHCCPGHTQSGQKSPMVVALQVAVKALADCGVRDTILYPTLE